VDIIFKYDHSLLKITDLHGLGVRSPKWLEEVLEDSDSQIFDITEPNEKYPVHFAIGFSKKSDPIKYVFEREGGVIRSLYARKASKEEIKNEFCKFCR
jgi:hypothetical protein